MHSGGNRGSKALLVPKATLVHGVGIQTHTLNSWGIT